MMAILSGLGSEGTVSFKKEKDKNFCVVSTCSIKLWWARKIRTFHVACREVTTKKCIKKRDVRAKLLFC